MAMPDPALLDAMTSAIAARAEKSSHLFVVGICGAQGSGKSTLAAALAPALKARGFPAAVLSLDDLYLTRAEREALASRVHPLLRTRGVPGTHDLSLAWQVITALERDEAAHLPRFDKLRDERNPQSQWDTAHGGTRILLLEGWCLGAAAQSAQALALPVNDLERCEDPAGAWRGFANDALEHEYRHLFARLDLLALLAAPGFEVVARWRHEQEQAAGGTMDRAAIQRFVAHYERLTRHILAEMPARADIVAALDEHRRAIAVTFTADPQTTS